MFGQDDWILASFFFCKFMDLDFVSVHKHAKKELGQYPAILTSHLVNKPYKHVWNSRIEKLSRSYMGLFDINARKNRNTVLLGENFLNVHRPSLFSCDDKGLAKQLKTTAHP